MGYQEKMEELQEKKAREEREAEASAQGPGGAEGQTQAGSMGSESATGEAAEQSGGEVRDPYTMDREGTQSAPETSSSAYKGGPVKGGDEDLQEAAKQQLQDMGPVNLGKEEEE